MRSLLSAAKLEGGRAITEMTPRNRPFFYTPRAGAGDPGENTVTDSAPGVAEVYAKDLNPSQLDRVAAAVSLGGTVKPGCVRTQTWETDPADNGDGEFRFTFTVTTTDGKIVTGTAAGTAATVDTLTWGAGGR
ncbi:hypothetical protein BIV57_18010 [Mangrovactinospora gilvigrisea]|uniref:Uncharacterized protein n=1 Tax=Mangrovactinospora gilvigrisea TaxID=1428644 RepID=A0A1J7BC16_9ACTN|nr:hypothetical protein BIV57_18010 [Mangrovactinospora gilvigrisea]